MSWEGVSDFLGFLSGVFLVLTALRNDKLLTFASRFKKSVDDAKAAGLDDPVGKALSANISAAPAKWLTRDQVFLRLGVFLLLLSYACKLVPPAWSLIKPLITPAAGT